MKSYFYVSTENFHGYTKDYKNFIYIKEDLACCLTDDGCVNNAVHPKDFKPNPYLNLIEIKGNNKCNM